MEPSVTDVLTEEHRLILRMIALVEKNTALMEEGQFRNWNFFLDAVDFIRNYADRFHHAKEEDILFVELVKNGMPERNSPVEAMHIEHDQGRAYVADLDTAARKALAGEPGQLQDIARNARGYAELLRGHIDKEDNILYPLAERVLPGATKTDMLRAYEKAEQKTPELERKYLRIVERYEQGIH